MARPARLVRFVPRTDMRHHSGVNCCRCLIRPSNSAAQLPDDFFHRQTDRQDLAVGVLRSGDHHADWCGARYMAGNRQGAAVEQVDDCRVAQHAQVEAGISFVVLTCFGDRRRGLWGRRHQHRVIAGGGGVDRSDELLAQFNQFDVACGRDRLARADADNDARVIFVGPIFYPLSVPPIGFGAGQRAARS